MERNSNGRILMPEDQNINAVNFIINTISSLNGELKAAWNVENFLNYHFYIHSHNINIIFGRDVMEDFQEAIKGDHNSDYYRGLEGVIRFRLYIALGKAGLISKFSIAKQFLNEQRDWYKDISVSFERPDWFYKIVKEGLGELAVFLEGVIKKYSSQPELEKELKYIADLLSYYNQHKSFTESRASEASLGYLKAAAVAMILKKEKERLEIKIPRVLRAKDKEIYDIVDELRKDYFPQIKMPDCINDYAGHITDLDKTGEDMKEAIISSVSCGPLAKNSCDLTPSIKSDFSNNNVFLDIPYSNYEECERILRETLKIFGLNPVVAKDKLTSNAVLCKVCRLIKTCKYGITDISSGSNSVSYEYGLMHGLGMKVCLLLRSNSEKFTDIHGLEHVPYVGLRSFRIAVSKWILENVKEAEQAEVKKIIQEEEILLKKMVNYY